MLAVHNPSVFDREYTEMKFGHSNMQVFVWSSQDGAFNPAKAEAFCVINSDSINECNLIIFETVSFMTTKIFKVAYD